LQNNKTMNLFPKFILLATVYSTLASAEQLRGIDLSVPLEPLATYKKCSEAYLEAFQDKLDYEAQPNIELTCAANLNVKQKNDLKESFVFMCKQALAGAEVSDGRVTLKADILAGRFNLAYAMVRPGDCLSKAINTSYSSTNVTWGNNDTTSAPAAREGCSAYHDGCQ
jgi:hypothetical protein